MVKNFLIAVLVTAALTAGAGAQTASINANTLDGIAPGYAVSAIGGLKIDVASGGIFCSGTWVTWLESTLLVTNSTTNYVYLNTSSSCVPAVKTTPFTVADVPLAVVVAAGGQVTRVAERRGLIALPPSAVGNTPAIIAPLLGACNGAITNNATVVLFPFQVASTGCDSTSSFQGAPVGIHTIKNLHVKAGTASGTAGGGIVAVYKNGSAQATTCALGTTTACEDLTHSFITADADAITAKVVSAGGTLTVGPTYASGASSCTDGAQAVAFTNGTSGVAPVNATGTITVTDAVPVGAVTLVTPGAGYTASTPPTHGTVATCTGTAVFTGGTVTVDSLATVAATFEVQ
jgi:hypothetical protein